MVYPIHAYPIQTSFRNSSVKIPSQYSQSQVETEGPSKRNPYNHPELYFLSNSRNNKDLQPSLEVQELLRSSPSNKFEPKRLESHHQSYYPDSHLISDVNMRGDFHGNNQNTTAGFTTAASKTKYTAYPQTRERTSMGNGDYGRETTATAFHGNRDEMTRGSARSNSRPFIPAPPKTSMPAKQWNGTAQPAQQPQFQRSPVTPDTVSLARCPSTFLSSNSGPSLSLGGHRQGMSRNNGTDAQYGKFGPDRDKMKTDLAFSNSVAKSNLPGIGILPGSGYLAKNTGRRQYHNSFPTTARNDMSSSNLPYSPSKPSIVTYGNDIGNTPFSTSTTTLTRADEVIENLRSNVAKANDLAHDNLAAERNSYGSWFSQGMPITDDQACLQDKLSTAQKRQLQESYRYELEQQIEQTRKRKELEKIKASEHPLGAKYESPGLSHWHQTPPVLIPPEKSAAIAKLLEKSTSSSTRLNQSPEYARREVALENLRKSRTGPNLVPTNSNNYQNIPNTGGSGFMVGRNNNSLSQQSHPVAQAFRTNSSLSNQSPDIPPFNPQSQQNYGSSSFQNMDANPNYNQGAGPQLPQLSRGGGGGVPAQDAVASNQYSAQRQGQVNYPNNNNINLPPGYGQPVPNLSHNGNGPWPNIMQHIPPYGGGYYPPSGIPFNPQYPYQQQPRITNPQIPPSPNGYFQAQNGGQPINSVHNVQRLQGGQGQFQNQQAHEVQSGQQNQQRQLNNKQSWQEERDVKEHGLDSFRSKQELELQNISSNYRIRPPGIDEKTSSTNFMTEAEELIDFEKLKEDVFVKPKSWQTSEDLPNQDLKNLVYKAELQQQISQNKRARELKSIREAEMEAKLDRDIQEYNYRQSIMNDDQTEARRLIEAQNEVFNQNPPRGFENPEIRLARKLGSQEHLGGGDRSQWKEAKQVHFKKRPSEHINTARKWSPPIPTVQRQLGYSNEINMPQLRSDWEKPEKLGLDMDFMNALQTTISSERKKVENRLREKLDTAANCTTGYH